MLQTESPTFLKVGLCGTKCLRSICSGHLNVFDNREDVDNVVWSNGSFAMAVK